jgi:YndJ-like protein
MDECLDVLARSSSAHATVTVMLMIPVMNLALVLAVALVMPLCLGGNRLLWVLAAIGVIGALALPDGVMAALLVTPWLTLVLEPLLRAALAREWLRGVAAAFGVVAATALIASRLQLTLFGITEPIVKLTALHFSYAGVGTLTLATWRWRAQPEAWSHRLMVGLTVVAPALVALGFITRLAVFQVGGAVLMTLGAWAVAVFTGARVPSLHGAARWLTAVSALSPWVSMVLAVAWAANGYWPSVPALTVVDMVPTHGALNAFGFVLCGLVARRLQAADSSH